MYEPNRTLASITHLLGLVVGFLGPLVVYLTTSDAFVKRNAANALNWQIIFVVYGIFLVGLLFLAATLVPSEQTFIHTTLFGSALLILPLLFIVDLVFIIIATMRASKGEEWEYPLTPKLL